MKEASKSPNIYISLVGSTYVVLNWNTQSLADLQPKYMIITATLPNQTYPARGQTADFKTGALFLDGLDPNTLYNVSAQVYGTKARILVYSTSIETLSYGKLNTSKIMPESASKDCTHRQSTTIMFMGSSVWQNTL